MPGRITCLAGKDTMKILYHYRLTNRGEEPVIGVSEVIAEDCGTRYARVKEGFLPGHSRYIDKSDLGKAIGDGKSVVLEEADDDAAKRAFSSYFRERMDSFREKMEYYATKMIAVHTYRVGGENDLDL